MKIWKKNYQEILFFLCGNYGFLCFWESLSGIDVRKVVICLWMILFTGALWYFYFENRKRLGLTACVGGIGALVVVIAARTVLLQQAAHVWSAFTGIEGLERQNVTCLMLLVMTFVMILLFVLEFVWKNHAACCLLMMVMLVIGPILGIPSSFKAIFFLAIFQLSFLITSFKKAAGILTVVVFAAVFLSVSFHEEQLYHAAYRAEHFVHNTILFLTGKADETVADGHISRGNRAYCAYDKHC